MEDNRNSPKRELYTLERRIWINRENILIKDLLFGMFIFFIFVFCLVTSVFFIMSLNINYNLTGVVMTFVFFTMFLFIYKFFLKKMQIISYASFVYDEGLFLVMMTGRGQSPSAMRTLSVIEKGQVREGYKLKPVLFGRDFEKEPPIVWKFTKVKDIIKINKKIYKIEAEYIDLNWNKNKKVMFKLKNRYNDFEDLVNIFEYYKET